MTAPHSDLRADPGCRRNISIHAHPPLSVRIGEIRDIRALCWCPGVFFFFFFFFVLSARGKTAAKPQPLPLEGQGSECAHQPVWKSAFSRILPEGKTRRNPLRAPAACWMLYKQLTDTAQGTPVRRLFKRTGDSNLDASQAEGPKLFIYCLGGIPQRCTTTRDHPAKLRTSPSSLSCHHSIQDTRPYQST